MDNRKILTQADGPSRNRVLKPNRKTPAAQWNTRMLRGLADALEKDPEADITTLLPRHYSQKLRSLQKPGNPTSASTFPIADIRSRFCTTDKVTVVFELEPEVTSLLQNQESISESIVDLLAKGEVLHEGLSPASVMVFRVADGIAVKITDEDSVATEHTSLVYLKEHLSDFPAPKPLGAVRFGIFCLLFTTFIPGLDLERAWPRLEASQKSSISTQLDTLFSDLRSLPFPENRPLGGVNGDGCKDARRALRVNAEPILDVGQFDEFIFSRPKRASPLYTGFLRRFIPADAMKCVFTHGDVRPANIMVDRDEDGAWKVVGVIDWERSGFYPEYWESVKVNNNLAPMDRFDWYDYLPECISPNRYPIRWLLDRVWDRSMENS
ncbi:APH-domain-containing protein [Coniochaeta ligniaria NRRL 30616]|uniref:APH-domain-containing protein n=1 Tax=Coniochaeta ligniaria NRRL 30616 TaxID=1408157 RepID=A0A1J7JQ30_9PEZI|nr:APH-domain-containing protein [Coniochaeta ligniaria NRRL 30616]